MGYQSHWIREQKSGWKKEPVKTKQTGHQAQEWCEPNKTRDRDLLGGIHVQLSIG